MFKTLKYFNIPFNVNIVNIRVYYIPKATQMDKIGLFRMVLYDIT